MSPTVRAVALALALAHPPAARPAADPNPGHLNMALVCFKAAYSDGRDPKANRAAVRANLDRHLAFIDRLAADGAEFVGFPELSLNGYRFSRTMAWLKLDGPEVTALQKKAAERRVYVSAGLAEEDARGRRWNTQVVIDPDGRLIGCHHKVNLTEDDRGFTRAGSGPTVVTVKGAKVGIAICADGSDRDHLRALKARGATIIYGPHASGCGGTTAGWYDFRKPWAGPRGWIADLRVYAALHNHAGLYHPRYHPPAAGDRHAGWASGAWFIGPDGKTLARMPASARREDSKEFVLVHNVPIREPERKRAARRAAR